MSPAFSLLLALAGCTLLRGKLLPPRDVRLEAQNFHVHLRWEPGPDAPSGAMYQVEWRRRNSRWIKAHACWGNSTSSSWACELHFVNIYDIYWARVRAVARGKLSKWASSSELQPYRDTVVGPPTLSWLLQGQILSVNIITPLTPYRSRAGTYRRVDRVLRKLWYRLHLHEGEVLVQEVSCKWSGEGAQCTVGPLKTSTHYCIRTVAVDMARQSREAEQCMVTPPDPTSFPWFIVLLSVIFPLLILAGLCFIQLQVFPSSSETHLPKTLALLNQELSVTREVPTLELQEDSLSLFLPSMSTSCRPPVAEEPAPTVQLLLGGSLHQDASGYCANGFGPGCHKGSNPSCTHGQAGHALGSQLPLQLEKNGEADGDDVLEQPAGSGKDSCTGDRDYRTSQVGHPELYLKCQCPALGADICLPLPAPGRSFIQEGTQEALGLAGHCVLLSSVKLHGSNEEDGGQIVHALQPLHSHGTEPQPCDSSMQPDDSTMLLGHLERAPLSIPSPCQLPLSTLRAAAFSGYELCPWADREP